TELVRQYRDLAADFRCDGHAPGTSDGQRPRFELAGQKNVRAPRAGAYAFGLATEGRRLFQVPLPRSKRRDIERHYQRPVATEVLRVTRRTHMGHERRRELDEHRHPRALVASKSQQSAAVIEVHGLDARSSLLVDDAPGRYGPALGHRDLEL